MIKDAQELKDYLNQRCSIPIHNPKKDTRHITQNNRVTSKLVWNPTLALFTGSIDGIPITWDVNGRCTSSNDYGYDIKSTYPPPETTPSPQEKAGTDKVGTGLVMVPFYSILRIGAIFVEGLRYGRDNWKKGVNDKEYQEERLEHAMLHLIKWKEGDRSEDHLAKVAWFCVTQMDLERMEKENV